jgi:hypothetical protein
LHYSIQAGVGASFFDPVLGTYTGLIVSKTNNTFQKPNRELARVKLPTKHIRSRLIVRRKSRTLLPHSSPPLLSSKSTHSLFCTFQHSFFLTAHCARSHPRARPLAFSFRCSHLLLLFVCLLSCRLLAYHFFVVVSYSVSCPTYAPTTSLV